MVDILPAFRHCNRNKIKPQPTECGQSAAILQLYPGAVMVTECISEQKHTVIISASSPADKSNKNGETAVPPMPTAKNCRPAHR